VARDNGGTEDVEIADGEPAVAGDLQIELDRYFPDFALDDANNPFSRSDEPRNPAALLRVYRGNKAWRVFVLQAMPGVHQLSDLGARLSLRGVMADPELEMSVAAQPAAAFAAAGLVLLAVGLVLAVRP
jgi:hypothetical protein